MTSSAIAEVLEKVPVVFEKAVSNGNIEFTDAREHYLEDDGLKVTIGQWGQYF